MIIEYPLSVSPHKTTITIPKPTPTPINTALSLDAIKGGSWVVEVPVGSVSNSTKQIRTENSCS